MKSLSKFKEEYQALSESSFKGFGLEKAQNHAGTSPIPSAKEMPIMLVFRRVQYKVFPNRQVIALYYSKMVDKYLSIPFGPTGNLNLSEAIFYDNLQEITDAQERENAGIEKNYGVKEYIPGYVDQKKAVGNWKKRKYGQALKYGVRSTGKKALAGALAGLAATGLAGAGAAAAGAGAGAAGTGILAGAKNLAKGVLDSVRKSSGIDSPPVGVTQKPKATVKGKSGWEKRKAYTPDSQVTLSKLKQADLEQAKRIKRSKTNTISEIKEMIKTGIPIKELTINGRPISINTTMANKIVNVYESVNSKNKRLVEDMLNQDLDAFKKLLNFAIKQ